MMSAHRVQAQMKEIMLSNVGGWGRGEGGECIR